MPIPINRPDIRVSNDGGYGFFCIWGESRRGKQWIAANVDGAGLDGSVYCDDIWMAGEIADGAVADGLRVA